MKFENTEVWGFEHALRGMRNPMNSWEKSDSYKKDCSFDMVFCNGVKIYSDENKDIKFIIGKNDMKLAKSLVRAGEPHRKFMRQIFVSVDVTAPLYWWKEFDTYKIGTVSNSTSTMHKLASTPITRECFEMDDFENLEGNFLVQDNGSDDTDGVWYELIENLEWLRWKYNETKDKRYWKELIRLLPESWLQKRTITMNYENILNMVYHRKNHKLTEWSESFINWTKTLPYADEFFFNE